MQSGLSGYLPSNIQYTSFMPLILGIISVIIVFVAIHMASGSNTITLARAKTTFGVYDKVMDLAPLACPTGDQTRLCDYYIASSSYSVFPSSYTSDYISDSILPLVIKAGARLIELDIYAGDKDKPVVGLKNEQFSLFKQDSLSFYGKPNNQYLLDNYVRFNTLEEVLREYVSPVMLRKKNDQFFINAYDAETTSFFTPGPLVLMDGVPQLDFNSLLNNDPLKIKKLEVVDRTYYYGKNTFYGIQIPISHLVSQKVVTLVRKALTTARWVLTMHLEETL